jgi:fatty-acyl-CoA synthase
VRAPHSRTLFDLLEEQAAIAPDAPVVLSASRCATYRGLLGRVSRIALGLEKHGVQRGDRVAALICNRLEWLELAFAASAVGAIFTPYSTWSTRYELAFLLADSQAKLFVSHARYGDRNFVEDLRHLYGENPSARLPAPERVLLIEPQSGDEFLDYETLALEGERRPLPPGAAAGAADDAFILYTSGSSAVPKAVRLRHSGAIENGFNIGERMACAAVGPVVLVLWLR